MSHRTKTMDECAPATRGLVIPSGEVDLPQNVKPVDRFGRSGFPGTSGGIGLQSRSHQAEGSCISQQDAEP